jgi:hypothetical protein
MKFLDFKESRCQVLRIQGFGVSKNQGLGVSRNQVFRVIRSLGIKKS